MFLSNKIQINTILLIGYLYFCYRCINGPRVCFRDCQQYGLHVWWYWINWKFSSGSKY